MEKKVNREVEWQRMTAPQLQYICGQPDSLAIIPIGSLEQHGPHLAVATDTMCVSAASLEVARFVANQTPVAVLPGLWCGLSEHHFPFGGTISLDFKTLHAVIDSIVRSLKVLGFSRMLLVNGHGGNREATTVAARELSVKYDVPIVSVFQWDLAPQEVEAILENDSRVCHAGEGEASLMMAIAPDLVKQNNFTDAAPQESLAEKAQMPSGAYRFDSFAERAPTTGTLGDPRLATAEKGHRLLRAQVLELAKIIRESKLWTRPDGVWQKNRGQGPTDQTSGHPET